MWHHPACLSSSWLVLCPNVTPVMFSSPNELLEGFGDGGLGFTLWEVVRYKCSANP